MGKFAHQLQTEALKLVLLYQLVEVDGEEFERDADVVAEDEAIVQVDHIHLVVLILLLEVFEDLDLLLGLSVKARLVAHHLERHVDVVLVVVSLHYLAEAALAQDLQNGEIFGCYLRDNRFRDILLQPI